MLFFNENIEIPGLKSDAESICVAAVTSPKRKCKDLLVTALVADDNNGRLQDRMRLIGERYNVPSFLRDPGNLELAPVIFL